MSEQTTERMLRFRVRELESDRAELLTMVRELYDYHTEREACCWFCSKRIAEDDTVDHASDCPWRKWEKEE